jgi:hypothetical protein
MTRPDNLIQFQRSDASHDDFRHRMMMNGISLFWIASLIGLAAWGVEKCLRNEEMTPLSFAASIGILPRNVEGSSILSNGPIERRLGKRDGH